MAPKWPAVKQITPQCKADKGTVFKAYFPWKLFNLIQLVVVCNFWQHQMINFPLLFAPTYLDITNRQYQCPNFFSSAQVNCEKKSKSGAIDWCSITSSAVHLCMLMCVSCTKHSRRQLTLNLGVGRKEERTVRS